MSIILELPPGLEAWLRAEAERLEVPPGYVEEWIRQTVQAELAAMELTLPPRELQQTDSPWRARWQQSQASMEYLAQTMKERARSDIAVPDGTPPERSNLADKGEIIGPASDLTPAQRVAELHRLIEELPSPAHTPPLETLTRESFYKGRC